ncbi:hypothetical protein TNCV_4889911 [Trichonephila clavipes]|nr:hypothetical protein TNCV_4889911 [Trichonephila clavipes]
MSDAIKIPSEYTREYVLVKSVGPKVLWTELRVQRTREYFPPFQFHRLTCGGEDRCGVAVSSSLRGISPG